jgi:hypothetical protein
MTLNDNFEWVSNFLKHQFFFIYGFQQVENRTGTT